MRKVPCRHKGKVLPTHETVLPCVKTRFGNLAFESRADGALRRIEINPKGVGLRCPETPAEIRIASYLAGFTRGRVGKSMLRLRPQVHSDFSLAVLSECSQIPRGRVASYRELARRVGRPGAARAVAQILAHNPLPLVIPCHRVVSSDGRLGGYAHGVALKQALLRLEGIRLDGQGAWVRVLGYDRLENTDKGSSKSRSNDKEAR